MSEASQTRALRWRLTALATIATGVVLLVGSVLLLTSTERILTRAGDEVARSRVAALSAALRGGDDPSTLDVSVEDGFVQVVDATGEVLAASANLGAAAPVVTIRPSEPTVLTAVGPDDDETERYRVWAQQAPDQDVAVYVGTSLESVDEATRTVRRALLVGVPVVLALLAAASWWLIGRTLRPVVAASRRQREFVADASHELQSPIAAMRVQLEVAATTPGTDWPALVADLTADTEQMERLVRDLLFLAAIDEGAPAPPEELVDLDDLVLEEAERARAGGLEIDTSRVSGAPVRGRRDELRRVVRNLIENAVDHAASRVAVSLTGAAGRVRLVVADDGPGVRPADRERVFERFYIGDGEARHRGASTGLGLAIARAIVERQGGSLVLEPEGQGRPGPAGGGGAAFVVELPAG